MHDPISRDKTYKYLKRKLYETANNNIQSLNNGQNFANLLIDIAEHRLNDWLYEVEEDE